MKRKKMANIFKQIAKDVAKFKSKHIAPQVLIEQMPTFKAEYEKAMVEYRTTDAYQKTLKLAVKQCVNEAIYKALNDDEIIGKVRKAVFDQVVKELINGNK